MGGHIPDKPEPDVPPPPPRQPDESLKGYIERRNEVLRPLEDGGTAAPSSR